MGPGKTGKKAISPIIAIIVILLLTISIAGAAYSCISIYWASTVGQNLAVVDAYPTGNEANLIVRNTGTRDITLGEVKILDSADQEVQGDWTTPEGQPIVADPLFVSPDPQNPADFKLQAGSPAIDAGVDVGLTLDYEGNIIPQDGDNNGTAEPDIGAYEYVP